MRSLVGSSFRGARVWKSSAVPGKPSKADKDAALCPASLAQPTPSPEPGLADPAESGHSFLPEGCGLLATEAVRLPGQAGSGRKHFLPAGVEGGSRPLGPRLCFQVAVEESWLQRWGAPSQAAVLSRGPPAPSRHTQASLCRWVTSRVLQETMFM